MLHVVVQRFHELLGRWRGVFLQQSASLLVQIGEDAPRLVDVAATEVGACGLELERESVPAQGPWTSIAGGCGDGTMGNEGAGVIPFADPEPLPQLQARSPAADR